MSCGQTFLCQLHQRRFLDFDWWAIWRRKFLYWSYILQHNKNTYDSKVTQEIRYFDQDLLEDSRLIGPSHPWLCFIVKSKKFNRIFKSVVSRFFENLWSDSLWQFWKEVLEIDNFIHLEPFGTSVKSISKELEKKGIYELEGCYLIKHSRNNQNSKLTNRIHGQGIYEFDGKYWNSVQSDASIWSSPPEKNPEIEALSLAKVREEAIFLCTCYL